MRNEEGERLVRRTLDFERAPSVLIVFAANRLTRIWSRYLQTRFGISVIEWRLMVMLTAELAVSRAADVIDVDRGAISRALAGMVKRGLTVADVPQIYRHRRLWRLTTGGARLHDEILEVASRVNGA